MITGVTVMGQAGKCNQMMDILKVNGILDKFNSPKAEKALKDDIPTQIKKLADLKNQGILTDDEFSKKKTDLLARM